MITLLLGMAAAAEVWTSTAAVRDLATDGEVVVVATSGGGEVYDADGVRIAVSLGREALAAGFVAGDAVVGTPLGAWVVGGEAIGPRKPVAAVSGDGVWFRDGSVWAKGVEMQVFGQPVIDVVVWDGRPVGFTAAGEVLGLGETRWLPGPAMDVAVVGDELRVACVGVGVVLQGDTVRVVDVPSQAAGPLWGTAEGVLMDGLARVGAVGSPVTGVVRLGDRVVVGTEDGVWAMGAGLRRWTPEAMPCRPFVTGVTVHEGDVVVGTFDGGACRQTGSGWTALALPSPLVNDVLSDGERLFVATSEGLVIDDVVVGLVADDAARSDPGLNHVGVTALALGPGGKVWATDVLGPVEISPRWRRHRFGVSGHSHQAVAACDDGSVWVGTEDDGLAVRGLSLGQRNGRSSWWHVNRFDGLPEDWVMDVACAEPGAAWVGTYRQGVGKMSADGWEPVVTDLWVQDLLADGDRLWVGSPDGLLVVEDGVPRWVLPEVDVFSMVRDGDRLLVGSRAGLWIVDLEER